MNNDRCQCENKNLKEHLVCEKYYIWNPATCSCKNGKHLASILDDSVITFHESIDETRTVPTKTIPTNFIEKEITCRTKTLYVLFTFLLIHITLLIAVNINCYLVKYQAKQKFCINKCIIKMESNEKLKEIDIKNRTCYYFDYIIKFEDFDLDNILIHKKPYENVLVYTISYRSLIGEKPSQIMFNKKDGLTIVYDGTRYLVLFGGEKHDYIYNRIRYLIGVKGGVMYVTSHNYAKIKVDSYDSLPLEKKH